MGSDMNSQPPEKDGVRRSWVERLGSSETLVPRLAVVLVVVAAVATTVMVTQGDRRASGSPPLASSRLGAGAACRDCGVVESVAPVSASGAYRMRVRMNDGTVRTVEQHAAVPAGARVRLEGGSLRIMPGASRPASGAP